MKRKKRNLLPVLAALAALAVAASWWVLRPSAAATGSHVVVDEPPDGSHVQAGQRITGHTTAGGVVHVWVEGFNVDLETTAHGDTWTYTYPGGLTGSHALVFSSVQDGAYGPTLR